MIQAFHQLGEALKTDPEYDNYFASYTNPFPKKGQGEDTVIVLEIKKDKVTGYTLEPFKARNSSRYLYRKPKGARGAPLVATGPYYPVHSLETQAQQKKQRDNLDKVMSRIERSIPAEKSKYFSDCEVRSKGLMEIDQILYNFRGAKQDRFIYTITIDGQYLGDIAELRNLLDEEAYTKYYEKSKAEGKTCALSHEQNVEVWGRVDTLGFTVNDLTFNRGGFNGKDSYRMFPVSKPAALSLEAARRFAFARLADRFYTLEYLVMPRMIVGEPEQLVEIVEAITDKKAADQSLTGKANPIIRAGSLIDILTEEETFHQPGLLYDILFFQKNQAQLALQLHLQDIPPTRFGEIASAIKSVNDRYGQAFGYWNGKTEEFVTFRLNLGVVKDFFSEGKALKIRFDPFFFRLLEAIFHRQTVTQGTVLAALMAEVRLSFKNDADDYHTPFRTIVFRAIATQFWLRDLGVLSDQNSQPMQEETTSITLTREDFLREHNHYFGEHPALKGAFFVGILTGILTYAQYDHLKSKPFLNRLNNLNLGKEELRGLIPQIVNKIQQYQNRRTGYRPSYTEVNELVREASTMLMTNDRVSRNEISFAFTTGMVMQEKFARDRKRKRDEQSENDRP